MDSPPEALPSPLLSAAHRLIQDTRQLCLWFMREDYLPGTASEVDRALAAIEAHGDLRSWAEARRIRAWLSQLTSGAS